MPSKGENSKSISSLPSITPMGLKKWNLKKINKKLIINLN